MFILLVQSPAAAPPPTRRRRSRQRHPLLFLSIPNQEPEDSEYPQSVSITTPQPAHGDRWPLIVLVTLSVFFIAYLTAIHPWFMNWGATEGEQEMSLPGDQVMNTGRHRFTRAISIDAPPSVVWPWMVQMGQERAGFYSNTWLENMFGLNIHTPDEINPNWQKRKVGDLVLLAPRDFLGGYFPEFTQTRVLGIEAEHWIAYPPFHFVLQPIGKSESRLLIRESIPVTWFDRFLNALFWDPFHFVMEARMLRGIKEHAEGVPLVSWKLRFVGRAGWVFCTLVLLFTFVKEPDRLPFLLLPLLWAVPVVVFTADWDAAMAAFLTLAIPTAATILWGRKSWAALLLMAAAALLILIVTPDPFCSLGIALGALTLLRFLVVF